MERWDPSNCMSLMIMKRSIPEVFRGIMSEEVTTAKSFLEVIEKMFANNQKRLKQVSVWQTLFNDVKRNRKHNGVHHGDVSSWFKTEGTQVLSEDLLVHFRYLFLHSSVNLSCATTIKRTNDLLMNSSLVQDEERREQERLKWLT